MACTLRLIQTQAGTPGEFNVRLELEDKGPRRSVQVRVKAELTEHERNEIRWYMEDYLEHPYDPFPQIARRVEGRMAEVGKALFDSIFQDDRNAGDFWARIRDRLHETRIEISTSVQDAAAIPWELLRDSKTEQVLALTAREFVRVQSETACTAEVPQADQAGPVRVLLVICRPGGEDDVGFRSVARNLVKGLTDQGRARVRLDLLRPPTFEQLAKVLEAAKEAGRPYHVVHFDGHGLYADTAGLQALEGQGGSFNPNRLDASGVGAHGYLAFEKTGGAKGIDPVGGTKLGALLFKSRVPVLVLNACRSAHADSVGPEDGSDDAGQTAAPTGNSQMVRAYGSLAQEVVDQGVAGVVAMRYNVYVVTAAQFVGELYDSLANGRTLGRAVARARCNLADNPARHVHQDPIDLQDWPVPVIYEAAPIPLFPPIEREDSAFAVSLAATGADARMDDLPAPPDIGFFGRDGTLLAIDRAFDRHNIVLLHAYAGAGKTATAIEFARWYRDTGGVGGECILFDSFNSLLTLKQLVDKLGAVFGKVLAANGIQWLSLDDAERRDLALELLRQIPVLWIWDNVEPVAGFPAGTPSLWSASEQTELADFLRDLAGTRAKVLLTSRRDERSWLGDVPARVKMPAMPKREGRLMAEELVRRHNRNPDFVKALDPLLDFSAGNPMTLTIVIRQCLRDNLADRSQVDAFVAELRKGEKAFDGDGAGDRDRSLNASLAYGFDKAFSPDELSRLALLHLFQGFVVVDMLCIMGHPENPACLPAVAGLTRAEGITLLDRAAEIGLLTALGGGFYTIHPAVPRFLKTLFDRCHGAADDPTLSYVTAMGEIGNAYANRFIGGHHDVLALLRAEEQNLLHAHRLACKHGWWTPLIAIMQGLDKLYTNSGRWVTWQALVEDAIPHVTAAEDGPIAGREAKWGVVMEYRVGLAERRRDGAEVLRLLRLDIDSLRSRAMPLQARAVATLDWDERNTIRSLAASLHELGRALTEQGDTEAVDLLTEAAKLCRYIGDTAGEAIAAFNLGTAYLEIPHLRDLDQAETWYGTSLDLRDEHDHASRAQCHGQLGSVALERFGMLRGKPDSDQEELGRHLQQAERRYLKALELSPATALADRAVTHNMLALVYDRAGMVEPATDHYRKSIQFEELAGNRFGAGQSRANLALLLARNKNFPDALAFARAARADFASYDAQGAEMVAKTDHLIAALEQGIAQQTAEVPA